ncbi:hypothetical protein IU367_01655 [Aeromonas bestiarum]|uniref:DUF6701 domain-containing protein n=1 Tax=Aeromonas bestiarum TaxID=105751 RepID=UPI002379387E|nr:DUF6701 domain-containing protein [Aeromonas bestiarum]WDL82954.1 hypothetical protein IU367_01655 [Aeromonas bestiarum]
MRNLWFVAAIWLLSGSAAAFQVVDLPTYFPAVVQGHRGDNNASCTGQDTSSFIQNNSAKIFGTGGVALSYCSSNAGSGLPSDGCDTAAGGRVQCQISRTTIRGIPVTQGSGNTFQTSSGSDGDIGSCSAGQQLTLGSASQYQFGAVSLYSACTLTFSNARKEYRLNKLAIGGGAKVILPAGDYWINRLELNQGGQLVLSGNVRIFVSQSLGINDALLNDDASYSMLLFGYDAIQLNGTSRVSGYVYSDKKVTLNGTSQINGRVTSRDLEMTTSSRINDKRDFGSAIDHYELYYPSQTLTCERANLQLKACANSDCSTLFDRGATVTLSPAQGWSSNPVIFDTSGSAALNLQRYQAGTLPLSIVTAAPSAPLRCFKDGVVDATCSLAFVDAALRFNVSTFYAGASGVTSIRAIKSNDTGATKVCVPLLTGNQTLQFVSSKVVSETSNAVPTVNNTAITPPGNVNVAFNSDGVGQLTVQYPDAGVLRLDATFQKSDATGTLRLTGSDTFAVIPKAIALQAQGQSGCSGSSDSTFAVCPVYRKAGETFTLQARALNEQDQLTPGFATSNKMLSWSLLAPASGDAGVFSPTAITLANGMATVTANWSEVGVIRLGVSNFVPYPSYQDESPQLETVLRWSDPIGRFIPADFNLVSGDIVPACNAFSYMGQPFGVALDVLARNLSGGQTQNYTGLFAKGDAYLSVANNKDGKSLSARLRSLSALPWVNGRSAFTGNSEFVRLSDTQQDGPYQSLLFGLYMKDNDGERTLIASPDFNDAVAGNCSGAGCNARLIDSVAMQVYFGRLLAGTGAGLASAPLAVPLQMQYYEAGNWQLNKLDQCTQLSLANQGFSFLNPGQTFDATSRELNLGGNRKIKLGLGSSLPGGISAVARDGEILFQFAKPDISVRIPYKVDLSKQPSRPLWLSDPVTLQGEAIFGSSRGNDRIIYRREVMP